MIVHDLQTTQSEYEVSCLCGFTIHAHSPVSELLLEIEKHCREATIKDRGLMIL